MTLYFRNPTQFRRRHPDFCPEISLWCASTLGREAPEDDAWRMLSRLWSGLTVVIAVVVAGQATYIGHRSQERAAQLQQRLGSVERQSDDTIDKLERSLEDAKLVNSRLQLDLEEVTRDQTTAIDDLDTARAAAFILQQQVSTTRGQLRSEPPPLNLSLIVDPTLNLLRATAFNLSSRELDLDPQSAIVWIDGIELDTGLTAEPSILATEEELDVFEFQLAPPDAAALSSGLSRLNGVLCVIFERAGSDQPWIGEYWFQAGERLANVAIARQDIYPLSADFDDAALCAVDPRDAPWSGASLARP